MKNQKASSQSVLWWVLWITGTILAFFIAVWIWTPVIAARLGSIHNSRTAVIWVAAVFGTWMVILVPMIVVMYQKVDKAYDDARIRREKSAAQQSSQTTARFRSVLVEKSKRLLEPTVAAKLRKIPETVKGGHLVSATLKDGRKISNIFISNAQEILGIYDFTEMPFEGKEILDLEPADLDTAPPLLAPNWLRLDGVSAPE